LERDVGLIKGVGELVKSTETAPGKHTEKVEAARNGPGFEMLRAAVLLHFIRGGRTEERGTGSKGKTTGKWDHP